jgi:predicted ATP-dependent endonuclease of OLD family
VKIKEISLRNYRCWKSLEIKDLKKYNVFIGENSIGKSSILFITTDLNVKQGLEKLKTTSH